MIIQNDILSRIYIYCMGYETYKTPKHTSKKQKDFKYLENQTPQLVKKSRMQIRKVNKKGSELCVQNYDKSK